MHLISELRKLYKIETDWSGETYAGVHLKWNYQQGYFDLAMPHYVEKQLQQYGYKATTKKQDSPFPAPPIRYGKAAQTVIDPDPSPALTEKEHKFVQQVTGSFLYYGRAVDPTILMTLNSIVRQ